MPLCLFRLFIAKWRISHPNGGNWLRQQHDPFDFVSDEDLQFEEFIQSNEMETIAPPLPSNGGFEKGVESLMKNLSLVPSSPRFSAEPAKYVEKPAKTVNAKSGRRCIHQPR
ncbi:hypothetical protein V6Z12_A13G003400 [Gossypium hirsutum]